MRKLALVLCAALLAMGVSAPKLVNAKPAQAVGGGCVWSDDPGVLYTDWHASNWDNVWDTNPGVWRRVWADIWSYRYNGGNGVGQDQHCYRGYYASVWSEDGSGAYWHPHLRVWVCGGGPFEFDGGAPWGVRNDVITPPGSTYSDLNRDVLLPSGVTRSVGFRDYGFAPTPCLPQADNYGSTASSPTWQGFIQSYSPPRSQWYCDLDGSLPGGAKCGP